ncbi:MAG: ACT domain-containing protein [Saprospiraceae bacterium]|nr:ACT domain-containing protein [Saprospiraceae bacterium]
MTGHTDLKTILSFLNPILNAGIYVFAVIPDHSGVVPKEAILTFKEKEGVTIIIRETLARDLDLTYSFPSRWITLDVLSSLNSVGLTAVVSSALASADIPCNIVAGYHHDHLFVPSDHADKTLQILYQMMKKANDIENKEKKE